MRIGDLRNDMLCVQPPLRYIRYDVELDVAP